jgi:DNA polymerase I-like protein with 3'-5' exonuclease and polymerase domains
LAVDVETSGKIGQDEGELDEVGSVIRINFGFNPDEGVTVPWGGPWQDMTQRLLQSPGVKIMWNARFDMGVLRDAGIQVGGAVLDFMWAWHVLQSDLPRGLGFVAPFYSDYGAWKHLSTTDPGTYAAIDAVQTLRVAFGVTRDLKREGMWDAFVRHVYEYDTKVLMPAEDVGLLIDPQRLKNFHDQLEGKRGKLALEIDALVPKEIFNLHPKGGWVKPPKTQDFIVTYTRGEEKLRVAYTQTDIIKQVSEEMVQWCKSCYSINVTTKHRCLDKTKTPAVELGPGTVDRYFVLEPFNPNSPDQLLKYLALKGHKPGRPAKGSKTEKGSVGKKVLQSLSWSTKDPLYALILSYRAVAKVMGTYVEGTERKLKTDGRLHAHFLHVPSTMRLSCANPNLQNVVSDKPGSESLAAGFRNCVVPAPGHLFVSADYSGIEAVETGWCAGDPDYLRLASLGIHAYLASHIVGEPARLGDSDRALGEYFKYIKKKYPLVYERAKRCVHGTSYGMTWMGLVMNYPEYFVAATAKSTQQLLYDVAPKLRKYQTEIRFRAARDGFLGGRDHPFHYKHWFFEVRTWNSTKQDWDLGPDGKRCVAFYPQSISAGVLAEAALSLMDPASRYFIGDMYDGRTPIRALVHDDILLEVPKGKVDEALEKLVGAMEEPIQEQPLPWEPSSFLVVKAEAKVGKDWGSMEVVPRGEIGVASDTKVRDWEDEEERVEIA